MFKILCVTDRKLCRGDFLSQIKKIAAGKPDALILREKDMDQNSYQTLAEKVMDICDAADVRFIIHNFPQVAFALGAENIHLPLPVLRETEWFYVSPYDRETGVSCHSLEDVAEAKQYMAAYVTAGHVFETECKKGIPPIGLEMLKAITEAAGIPVYAIGGINESNIALTKEAGASGACLMSGFMTSDDPADMIKRLREKVE